MTPPELPPEKQGDAVTRHWRRIAPRGAAAWAGYFLTVFSLLLPGYSIILIQLRWHIHDGGLPGFVVLLLVLYIAFMTAFIYAWRLSRHFPVRGAVSLGISLLLLPRVIHFILTVP